MTARHHLTTARTRRWTFVAAAVLTVAGTTACGSDTDDTSAVDSDVSAEIGEGATLDASTTSEAVAPTDPPTTEAAAPVGAPDPDAAAATLYAAWKADDRTLAATVAEPAAVDGVFAATPGDYALYNRCDTGEFGSSSCLYRGDAGTIQFAMTDRDGAWVVTTAIFSEA